MKQVALIDYGSGNVHSAYKALEVAGDRRVRVQLTDDPTAILAADYVVLPGVGAFGDCAAALRARAGVWDALHEVALVKQRPFLGICVGMQLLAETGLERGEHDGLGWLPGVVRALNVPAGYRIPHMGWNQLQLQQDNPLISKPDDVYFVHSYCMETDADYVLATCEYGEVFPAIVQKNNLFGTQFHPEKSQAVGLDLLRNFLA